MNKLLAAGLLLLLLWSAAAGAGEEVPTVAPGKEVEISFTATADGRQVDGTSEGDPAKFVVGTGTMMPALEAALLGLRAGDETTFVAEPADAYGEIDADAVRTVPLTALPPGFKPEPGTTLEIRGRGEQGDPIKAVIRSVAGDQVELDFNHPLAGKTLAFRVKVLAIADAAPGHDPYPHATAAARTYPDLLKVTSGGVVYASRGAARNPDEIGTLFGRVQADANTALLQCGMQIIDVEVRGDIVPSYGLLNDASRTTLLGLVDRSTGTVTEEKVVAALLTPYAGHEERNRRGLTCELLLAPLAGRSGTLDERLGHDICPLVGRLTACLEDLRNADERVRRQAGDHAGKLYCGSRWETKRDYLDQLARPAP